MKFIIIYSSQKNLLPDDQELKKEIGCSYATRLDGNQYNIEENTKWAKFEQSEILYKLGFDLIHHKKDIANLIWNIDPHTKYYEGTCKIYLVSDDAEKRNVEWYALKGDNDIKIFSVDERTIIGALEFIYAAIKITNAHQYSSAENCREMIFEYHKNCLNSSEITYLERLSSEEKKIKQRFEKISERLMKKAKKMLTKAW